MELLITIYNKMSISDLINSTIIFIYISILIIDKFRKNKILTYYVDNNKKNKINQNSNIKFKSNINKSNIKTPDQIYKQKIDSLILKHLKKQKETEYDDSIYYKIGNTLYVQELGDELAILNNEENSMFSVTLLRNGLKMRLFSGTKEECKNELKKYYDSYYMKKKKDR